MYAPPVSPNSSSKTNNPKSCSGISFKSQALYLIVYITRYIDLFWTFTDSLYNTTFKLLFLASSGYTIYLMTTAYKPTHDPNLDTFRVQYLHLPLPIQLHRDPVGLLHLAGVCRHPAPIVLIAEDRRGRDDHHPLSICVG
jgi:hypothetical protein